MAGGMGEVTTTAPQRGPGGIGGASSSRELVLVAACAGLMAAASLPLARTFIGLGFLRPVGAAILLSLGGQLLARRAGASGVVGVGVGLVAWTMFISLAFLPSDALLAGAVPTLETLRAGAGMFADGVHLVRNSPAPTPVEPELLVLTVTGVWWIAHAVHVLAVRLRSPLHAIAAALVLWTVPLALAPAPSERAWQWAVPFLAAAVVVLLVGSDPARPWAGPRGGDLRSPGAGWATGAGAVVVGVLLVGYVPGFGDDPLVQPGRVGGGLTQTDNPIVDIRSKLVELGQQPVARVQASEPVYLRLTSLDRYSANERWTNEGISGAELSDPLPPEANQPRSRAVEAEIEVLGADGAVLVPAPYQPREVAGPRRDDMRWDADMATLAMATGERLENRDRYQVTAAVPEPPADGLRAADVSAAPEEFTHLPSVPDEVATLARRIVDQAGADNAFDAAMALQQELRSWDYSLEPPAGHSGSDMVDFIRNRVGYCEQFAGTMAVMLRSLDIPARVAVGYTPGEPVGEDEFVVRRDNSHAWVEVRFPGFGWITFEPTPRGDQNLLTPSAEAVAPRELDAERMDRPDDTSAEAEFGENEVPSQDQLSQEPEVTDPPEPAGDATGSGGGGDGGAAPWWWLGAVAAALTGAGTVLARRRTERAAMVPAAAVLTHLQRLERLGAGLGRPRAASDTDAEYILAIAGATDAGQALAAVAERARWARMVPEGAAQSAREAEQTIRRRRLAGLGAPARGTVAVRGWWYATRRRVSVLLRHRLPSFGVR